jgi:hypothetical protein
MSSDGEVSKVACKDLGLQVQERMDMGEQAQPQVRDWVGLLQG